MENMIPSNSEPVRVVVEVVSHSDVERLERRDEDLRKEIQDLNRKLDGLHRSFYDLLSSLAGR